MKIDFTLRLTTPAYAGGAEKQGVDGIRPPTVKALLRSWWRTMKGNLPPEKLFEEEEKLFGSTKKGQGLRVIPGGKSISMYDGIPSAMNYLRYFAYGVENRPALAPGSFQKYTVAVPDRIPPLSIQEIWYALWLLSAFGGLGGRSRRGWGSVCLEDIAWPSGLPNPNMAEMASAALEAGLNTIFNAKSSVSAALPGFTAFTRASRIWLGPVANTWEEALDSAAKLYHSYHRKLGANRGHGPVIGPDFIIRDAYKSGKPATGSSAPYGTAFGLPQNTYFSSSRTKVDVGISFNLSGRRASPIIYKILKVSTSERVRYVPLLLWLPGQFLPPKEHIFVKTNSGAWTGSETLSYSGDSAIREFVEGTGTTGPLAGSATGTWNGLGHYGWKEVTW